MLKLEAKTQNEKVILAYLETHASDYLAEKINKGTKTLKDCWSYITEEARKKASHGCACIEDSVVFGWAIHYFEEDSIKPNKTRGSSASEDVSEEDVTSVTSVAHQPQPKPKKKKEIPVNESQFSMEF